MADGLLLMFSFPYPTSIGKYPSRIGYLKKKLDRKIIRYGQNMYRGVSRRIHAVSDTDTPAQSRIHVSRNAPWHQLCYFVVNIIILDLVHILPQKIDVPHGLLHFVNVRIVSVQIHKELKSWSPNKHLWIHKETVYSFLNSWKQLIHFHDLCISNSWKKLSP